MTDLFDIKEDFLYLQGEEEGLKKGKAIGKEIGQQIGKEIGQQIGKEIGIEIKETVTVVSMFLKTDFKDEMIADLAKVDLKKVKSLRKEFNKTMAKKTYQQFASKDKLTKTETTKRNESVAQALVKMKSMNEKIIAQLTDLTEQKVLSFYPKKTKKQGE